MRDQIVAQLQEQANPRAAEGMARFGIRGDQVLGVSIPILRKMAKASGKNHALALELWETGIHEVRILASMIDEPQLLTPMYNCARIKLSAPRDGCKLWSMSVII